LATPKSMLQCWCHTGLCLDETLTSDPTADTQVGCQDSRRTDLKRSNSVSAMNISTSNTLFAFISGTTVARVRAIRMLYVIHWPSHMKLSHPIASKRTIYT
jgi:hypothetical protein